jgi:hypothetical protein
MASYSCWQWRQCGSAPCRTCAPPDRTSYRRLHRLTGPLIDDSLAAIDGQDVP